MGRPTQHNHPPRPVRPPGEGQNNTRPLCDTRIPHPPTQARRRARQAWRRPQRQGHARTFPFPNPEAKTASADGTAPARVWESRTPPPAHHKGGGPPRAPPFRTHTTPATRTRTATHGHTGHTQPHTRAQPHTRQSSPHRPHSHTHPKNHTHPHVRGHTATAPHTHGAIVNPTVRGHTGHSATRPHRHTRKHTTKFATPHRIFEHRFWASASCGRIVLNVVGLASIC